MRTTFPRLGAAVGGVENQPVAAHFAAHLDLAIRLEPDTDKAKHVVGQGPRAGKVQTRSTGLGHRDAQGAGRHQFEADIDLVAEVGVIALRVPGPDERGALVVLQCDRAGTVTVTAAQ